MSKKRNKQRESNLSLIVDNEHAKHDHAGHKKTYHQKDLHNIQPKNDRQHQMFELYKENHNLLIDGSAGVGKSFLALYLALNDILNVNTPYTKIIIVRSAVATRDLGFLKGDINDKTKVYEQPYIDICENLFEWSNNYANLKANHYLEFMTTSFLRGMTFDNSIVLVDEASNLNFHELDSIITRIGTDSKIMFMGDFIQSDLKGRERDGYVKFKSILNTMTEFRNVQFTSDDIVRSSFVKSYIKAREKIDE